MSGSIKTHYPNRDNSSDMWAGGRAELLRKFSKSRSQFPPPFFFFSSEKLADLQTGFSFDVLSSIYLASPRFFSWFWKEASEKRLCEDKLGFGCSALGSPPSHPPTPFLALSRVNGSLHPLPGPPHSPPIGCLVSKKEFKKENPVASLRIREDRNTARQTSSRQLPAAMQTSQAVCSVCLFFQLVFPSGRGWQLVLKNDATEIVPEFPENTEMPVEQQQQQQFYVPPENETMNNRAQQGERHPPQVSLGRTEPLEFSCREVYSTRYVTDGQCRSIKPIRELVCSGQCLPSHLLPNSIGKGKWWRQNALDYRCIPAHSRSQRVQLACPEEDIRTIKIRTITSCKCKRYTRYHNRSQLKDFSKETARLQKNKKPRFSRARGSKANQPELENSY
ncbi:sclerostin [Hemicordylus capensis]|uniref:sclerostin n=1 Tax=Hemicordylus capensis TaxID=884348 RepID=UPI002302F222|nr:sclerostin [Hemicordylus capensis]